MNRISSTFLGSIITSRKSSGELLQIRQVIIEVIHTLFPEPVVPAIKICGIVPRSAATGSPETSRPRAIASEDCILLKE